LCECRSEQNGETVTVVSAEKRDEGRQEVRQIDIGKEAAMEAEVKAARERAIIPLEIRMKQFRDMLSEKEVSFEHCISKYCLILLQRRLKLYSLSSVASHLLSTGIIKNH